jgi:hypothetical protein
VLVGAGLAPSITNSSIVSGNGGEGGRPGLGALKGLVRAPAGSGGDGGWSSAVYDLDVNDGRSPALASSKLTAGVAGKAGGAGGKDAQSGETNQ